MLWSLTTIAQNDGFVYQGEKEGIKVFFKESTDSPIKELKLTMYFDAKMSTIVAALNDIPEIPNWVYKTTESRLVKRVSDTEYYYYNLLDFPWPLSDRDMVLHSKFHQDSKTKIAKSISKGKIGYVDEREDAVRMTDVKIEWIFYPTKEGRIKLEYYLSSNPEGAIPAWIVNLAVDHGPIKSMTGFRELLKKEKYKRQAFSFVID
ncbi:MAG: START domain-containing protein [Saprospiraceae bacterium]